MTIQRHDIEGYGYVEIDRTPEMDKAIADMVIEFYLKQKVFFGESLMQNDDPVIEAPLLLADILDDICKFDVHYNG